MTRWICSLAAVAIISGGVLYGHHSIAAVYDSNRQASLEGVITQFQLINPHPLLWIDVTDKNGQTERWRLEMDNRSELVAVGVTAETLKPGDRVRVKGSLGRSQPQAMYLLRLDRPSDGFWYEQVGSSPKIRNR